MSAPSVRVYTEQRTREMKEHKAGEEGILWGRGPGWEQGTREMRSTDLFLL